MRCFDERLIVIEIFQVKKHKLEGSQSLQPLSTNSGGIFLFRSGLLGAGFIHNGCDTLKLTS